MQFEPNTSYPSIYFSGAAFFLPFHFGVVKALKDFNITFDVAYGISSGAHAALSALDGSDLHLGIRQCYDLSDSLKFMTRSYFYESYEKYFEKFRSSHMEPRPLHELQDRLHVGLYDLKSNTSYYHSTFESEEELKQIVSSSGNIIPFISLSPVVVKDKWILDALAIPRVKLTDKMKDPSVSLSVTPFGFQAHLPTSSAYITGSATLSIGAFFTSAKEMDALFIEGYQKMNAMIIRSVPGSIASHADIDLMLQSIKEAKKEWKEQLKYVEAIPTGFDWLIVHYNGGYFIFALLVLAVIQTFRYVFISV